MVQGLSHIVYTASSTELFELTKSFYNSLGFKTLSTSNEATKNDGSHEEIWLKLASNEHLMTTDIIIRLVLNTTSIPRPRPADDMDWSLNEAALSLSVLDVGVSINNDYFESL